VNDLGYREDGVWNGRKKFKCDFCKFATTVEVQIRGHVISSHQLALIGSQRHEVVKSMDVLLLDGNGKPITEREVTQEELRRR